MNPQTEKKFTQEAAERMTALLETLDIKSFIQRTKDASDEDTGTFEVVISTEDEDRHGEVVLQSGMSDERYMQNPVVLWGHDYSALPIGITESTTVEGGKRIAKGRFAPASANPFAQQVRKLYDLGMQRATSIGFIAKEMKGNVITQSELLEFSFVSVPANPYALSMRKVRELGIETEMFAMKGIALEVKDEDAPDDSVETIEKPKEGEEVAAADGAETATNEEKAKGEVSDEVAGREEREKKWQKIRAFDDIVYAFYNVYFEENTKAEEFETLLAETVELMKALLPADTTKSAAVSEFISKGGIEKRKELKEEVGAIMTEAQSTIDAALIDASQKVLAAVESNKTIKIIKSGVVATGGDSAGDEHPDGDASNERSKGEGDFEQWKAVQTLARSATTALTDALSLINERSKAQSRK